jgi:hypothetical protein
MHHLSAASDASTLSEWETRRHMLAFCPEAQSSYRAMRQRPAGRDFPASRCRIANPGRLAQNRTARISFPMPNPLLDNIAGHRAKYELTKAGHPPDQVGLLYVGGGDPILTGYVEIEQIKHFVPNLSGAAVVDIGCGIGRLARHMLYEDIGSYLGTDIIPEIMQEAIDLTSTETDLNSLWSMPAIYQPLTLLLILSWRILSLRI